MKGEGWGRVPTWSTMGPESGPGVRIAAATYFAQNIRITWNSVIYVQTMTLFNYYLSGLKIFYQLIKTRKGLK